MDNCSIHKGEAIEAFIAAAGAKLLYLPPYSPDFSPIENCWSKLKSVLRSIGAKTYPDLAKAIATAFAKVSLEDIRGWFTHCCYCTSIGWEALYFLIAREQICVDLSAAPLAESSRCFVFSDQQTALAYKATVLSQASADSIASQLLISFLVHPSAGMVKV